MVKLFERMLFDHVQMAEKLAFFVGNNFLFPPTHTHTLFCPFFHEMVARAHCA